MSTRTCRHVYGPVASRRLGRSLGIDLVPFKTCSYDCVYCQLGRTTNQTTERREYVPVDDVLDELSGRLRLGSRPDYIGLAGSGEPTLHSRIEGLIGGIKRLTDIPVAVLTNGSMLWVPEVRSALASADLVLPSLDAGTREAFERVNRPHREISFEKMVEGLIAFADHFEGRIWLEVFVLGGLTDRPDEIARIASIAAKVRPERVQLNTVSRPTAESWAVGVPAESLERLQAQFTGFCEVVAEYRAVRPTVSAEGQHAEDDILALVIRRPCTVNGIAAGLGLRPNEVLKHLDSLCARGSVRSERRHEAVFFEGVRDR